MFHALSREGGSLEHDQFPQLWLSIACHLLTAGSNSFMDRLEKNLDRAAAKPWNVRPAAERRVRPLCLCSALHPLPASTAPPRRPLHTML